MACYCVRGGGSQIFAISLAEPRITIVTVSCVTRDGGCDAVSRDTFL